MPRQWLPLGGIRGAPPHCTNRVQFGRVVGGTTCAVHNMGCVWASQRLRFPSDSRKQHFRRGSEARSARYRPLNNMENAAAPLTSQVLTERPRVEPVNGATRLMEGRFETRLVGSGRTSASCSFAESLAPLATVTSNLVAAAWTGLRTRTGPGLPRRFLAREP